MPRSKRCSSSARSYPPESYCRFPISGFTGVLRIRLRCWASRARRALRCRTRCCCRRVPPVLSCRQRTSFPRSCGRTAPSCRAVLAGLRDGAFPVLLQRRVQGPGEGLFGLRWDGRMVATFAHRRLREKPPEGGVSVYRESIAPPAELVAAGAKLLALLGWQGVAMVECKRDLATGRYVFMEVNGRLWGSLQLAIDAGVDFPALLVACALGSHVPSVGSYRVGVRSRWFWGDVDHLYLRLRHGNGVGRAGEAWGGRLAAIRDFLRFRPGRDREEIWRWRDPIPFVVETLGRLTER